MDIREQAVKILCTIISKECVEVGVSQDKGVCVSIRPYGEMKKDYKQMLSLKIILEEIEQELDIKEGRGLKTMNKSDIGI